MKDPELSFCSPFARGVLIDLLCLAFEATNQGELSKPDGTPRSEDEIVDAVRGSDRLAKLEALGELLVSGALKRDPETGVIYSSRLRRLAAETKRKKDAGAKGGKQKAANKKSDSGKELAEQLADDVANGKQIASTTSSKEVAEPLADHLAKGYQNRGVSDSDSASDTDRNTTHTYTNNGFNSLEEKESKSRFTDVIESIPEPLRSAFKLWVEFRFQSSGSWMPVIQQDTLLKDLLSKPDRAKVVRDIEFSITIGAKNICDSSKDLRKGDDRSWGERQGDSTGI